MRNELLKIINRYDTEFETSKLIDKILQLFLDSLPKEKERTGEYVNGRVIFRISEEKADTWNDCLSEIKSIIKEEK